MEMYVYLHIFAPVATRHRVIQGARPGIGNALAEIRLAHHFEVRDTTANRGGELLGGKAHRGEIVDSAG